MLYSNILCLLIQHTQRCGDPISRENIFANIKSNIIIYYFLRKSFDAAMEEIKPTTVSVARQKVGILLY